MSVVRAFQDRAVPAEALVHPWTPTQPDAWLDEAAACMQRHGVIVIPDAIPADAITAVLDYVKNHHDVHMEPGQKKLFRTFQTDPLRAQVPVAIEGPVANPEFFAPPAVLSLARRLLGDDIIVGEMGMVVSHPGAGPQETHRDSAFLFGGGDLDVQHPPVSLSVLVPLVDVTPGMGPTEFWPGTHRTLDDPAGLDAQPVSTGVRAGALTIHDARTAHRGGANVSGPIRPSIYFCFCRGWYRERPGYDQKPQVRVTPAMVEALPEAHRGLFAWALHLNRTDGLSEFIYRWTGRFRRRLLRILGR